MENTVIYMYFVLKKHVQVFSLSFFLFGNHEAWVSGELQSTIEVLFTEFSLQLISFPLLTSFHGQPFQWRFSIWVDKPTPGNALMNLRYKDERAVEVRGKG